jgi:hypothetical protein
MLLKKMPYCILILFFIACGDGFENKRDSFERLAEGNFYANLFPINPQEEAVEGYLNISIYKKQFWARVKLNGSKTQIAHHQYIHLNSTCPSLLNDLNFDGFLDVQEVFFSSGNILLPLDSDLSSQLNGIHQFPKIKKQKSYYYSKSAHSEKIMKDLRSKKNRESDLFIKLKRFQALDLEKRVIIVFAVREDYPLNLSQINLEELSPHSIIPLACGVIKKGGYIDYQ